MTDDMTPEIRKVAPFPVEHMRLIGEICVYWTGIEAVVLQAACESVDIGAFEGMFLGNHVPIGTRIDMLVAVAATLKEEDQYVTERGKQLGKLLEGLRSAYLLRNKYAHARLRSHGADKDPEIEVVQVTKKINIGKRPLPLQEIRDDANAIFRAGDDLVRFLQAHGFCRQSWS